MHFKHKLTQFYIETDQTIFDHKTNNAVVSKTLKLRIDIITKIKKINLNWSNGGLI